MFGLLPLGRVKAFRFLAVDDDSDSASETYDNIARKRSCCYYLIDRVVYDIDSLQMSAEVSPNRLATRQNVLSLGLCLTLVKTMMLYDVKFLKTDCTKSTRSTLFVNL